MKYFIVTENPRNGKLVFISEEDGDDAAVYVATFPSFAAAQEIARGHSLCAAWGYFIFSYPRV